MCGIAGILNLDGEPASSDFLKNMADAIAHRGPELVRDRPLMLDREVGNAAPCVDPVSGIERLGRAGVEAAAALAAMVALGGIRSERQAEIDLAKE